MVCLRDLRPPQHVLTVLQTIYISISTGSSITVRYPHLLGFIFAETIFSIEGSHPNDGDAHFRLSEEQIFTSIFAYVDHLFAKIKPKKLFFIAVDGVAPRAKMNQQRSRRFKTAREAKELKEKAERNGEQLPEEKAFDSNCITPGELFFCFWSFPIADGVG